VVFAFYPIRQQVNAAVQSILRGIETHLPFRTHGFIPHFARGV
jgi:hypothetical protein